MTQNQNSRSNLHTVSRQELRQLIQLQLQALLEQQNFPGAKALLVPVQPADIAEAISGLPEAMQAIAFRLLSQDEAIKVYEYLEPSVQQSLIEKFKYAGVVDIIDKMSPDDRARLFDELPPKVVRRLLTQISPEERETTALLLGYKPGTAGRIMTPEYISLPEDVTVEQALAHIRDLADTTETIYYLYVTDARRRLKGVVSLRQLVTAKLEQRIGMMTTNVIYVYTNTPQAEVAQIIQDYDFLAVPVVDTQQSLVGIITVDDVIDVLEQEITEDIYTSGGVQSGGDNYFQANLLTIARKRVVWLFILLITNTATSAVIRSQEDILEQVVALAAFIPLLIDTGGNVGAQFSTVVIRGLNTNEIKLSKALKIIHKEILAGVTLGVMLAVVVVIWAYFLQGNLAVAIAVGVSLLFISILASLSGSALPFLFRSLKFDPALMSAPLITTVVDVLGVLIYLSTARVILRM